MKLEDLKQDIKIELDFIESIISELLSILEDIHHSFRYY